MREVGIIRQTRRAQQLSAAIFDEVSIVRREPSLSQQGVNGFAGTNEFSRMSRHNLFPGGATSSQVHLD